MYTAVVPVISSQAACSAVYSLLNEYSYCCYRSHDGGGVLNPYSVWTIIPFGFPTRKCTAGAAEVDSSTQQHTHSFKEQGGFWSVVEVIKIPEPEYYKTAASGIPVYTCPNYSSTVPRGIPVLLCATASSRAAEN